VDGEDTETGDENPLAVNSAISPLRYMNSAVSRNSSLLFIPGRNATPTLSGVVDTIGKDTAEEDKRQHS
jgi:hypothetical protein